MQNSEVRVVIFIFINQDKILIEKRTLENFDGEQYLIPGGIVEETEELEDALKREMLEELGVIPLDFILLPTKDIIIGLKKQTLIPYLINKWFGKLPVVILDKGNPIAWLSIDEVLKTTIRPTREIVEALKSYLG